MPRQSIVIQRHGGRYADVLDDVDVWANFAIHEYVSGFLRPPAICPQWTVTHVPTGRACLHTRTKRAALAARRAFVGCGVAFDFSDPAAMSDEQRRIGKEICREWSGR